MMLLTSSAVGLLQLQPSQLDMGYFSPAFCSLANSLLIGIISGVKRGDVIVKVKAILLVGETDCHAFVWKRFESPTMAKVT